MHIVIIFFSLSCDNIVSLSHRRKISKLQFVASTSSIWQYITKATSLPIDTLNKFICRSAGAQVALLITIGSWHLGSTGMDVALYPLLQDGKEAFLCHCSCYGKLDNFNWNIVINLKTSIDYGVREREGYTKIKNSHSCKVFQSNLLLSLRIRYSGCKAHISRDMI